jgi:hypothetical protein
MKKLLLVAVLSVAGCTPGDTITACAGACERAGRVIDTITVSRETTICKCVDRKVPPPEAPAKP